MITATCKNDACEWQDVERNVLGATRPVMCGACQQWCEITDERDDPPMPDDEAPS